MSGAYVGPATKDAWETCFRDAAAESDRREADRKLGAAIRDAVMAGRPGRTKDPTLVLAHMADDCDARLAWTTPGEVLRTIIDALDAEGKRSSIDMTR